MTSLGGVLSHVGKTRVDYNQKTLLINQIKSPTPVGLPENLTNSENTNYYSCSTNKWVATPPFSML